MAFVQIASDSFTGLGSGVTIVGRNFPDNAALEYIAWPHGYANPTGDGADAIKGDAAGAYIMIGNDDGSRRLFNKVRVSFLLKSLTAIRQFLISTKVGANQGELRYDGKVISTGVHTIQHWANQVATQLDTVDVGTLAAKRVAIEVGPGYQKMYYDGAEILSSTDASLIGPFMIGWWMQDAGVTLDDIIIEEDDLDADPYILYAKDDAHDRIIAGSAQADIDGRTFMSDLGAQVVWATVPTFDDLDIAATTYLFGKANAVMYLKAVGGASLYTSANGRWGGVRVSTSGITNLYWAKDFTTWANRDGYELSIKPSGNSGFALSRMDNGSNTILFSGAQTWAAGTLFEIQFKPGEIKVLINGSTLWTSNDATYQDPLTPLVYTQNTADSFGTFSLWEPTPSTPGGGPFGFKNPGTGFNFAGRRRRKASF